MLQCSALRLLRPTPEAQKEVLPGTVSMDSVAVYEFLHKSIRNLVPGKRPQRRCIEALRAALFPEVLNDVRITAAEACREGAATRAVVHGPSHAPAFRVKSVDADLPARFSAPERHIPALCAYTFPDGHCFRTFALDRERRFIADTPAGFNDLYRNNKDIRTRRPVVINEDAVALNTWHASGYYPWFVELVGRMLLWPARRDKLFCVDDDFPYQAETFALLGVPKERVLTVADYRLYRFRSVTVVNAPPHGCCVPALSAVRELSALVPR
ncbi:MAG: glycosyltransferase family 61 protein, partial [Desulfovibrio sp.]|nr:glycosyltransferase family 61 protein [Desulfovibrio sp.]